MDDNEFLDHQQEIREFEEAGEKEYLKDNPVKKSITYHRFVSKSKGIRNGKQRIRRNFKEVHLVKYRGGVQPMAPFSLRYLCN